MSDDQENDLVETWIEATTADDAPFVALVQLLLVVVALAALWAGIIAAVAHL